MKATKAFTLIELLIVVAIIAILAAIAVPNFLEAQTRAKTARASSDLRTLTLGLESYYVDNNAYPRSNNSSRSFTYGAIRTGYKPTLERITTPIAYLSGEGSFYDPFRATFTYQGAALETRVPITNYPDAKNFQLYWYIARNETTTAVWDQNDARPKWWVLMSAGPDGGQHNMGTALNGLPNDNAAELAFIYKTIYDATNGTVSRGSIMRAGGGPSGVGKVLHRAITTASK